MNNNNRWLIDSKIIAIEKYKQEIIKKKQDLML